MVLIVHQNWGKHIHIVFVWTVVWTRIDRYVFGDNENVYFWKGISVDRTLLIFPYLQKHQNLTSSMACMQKLSGPEARFSKVPIINGPVKLLLFT